MDGLTGAEKSEQESKQGAVRQLLAGGATLHWGSPWRTSREACGCTRGDAPHTRTHTDTTPSQTPAKLSLKATAPIQISVDGRGLGALARVRRPHHHPSLPGSLLRP